MSRKPVLFDLEASDGDQAPDVSAAPPVPDPLPDLAAQPPDRPRG